MTSFLEVLRGCFPTDDVYPSNRSKTLYTGVTNNLLRRVREHSLGTGSGFTAKYRLNRLVYFERFDDIRNAIEREKRIKGWLRKKKIALIVGVNPEWKDLSLEWHQRHQFQPEGSCIGPSRKERAQDDKAS